MKIAILGAGNMAFSLLAPLKKELSQHEIKIFTPTYTRAHGLAQELGGLAVKAIDELQDQDVYLLACKPQQLDQLSLQLSSLVTKNCAIVSILAAITTQQLSEKLGTSKVLRLMPNTPCMVAAGVISMYANEEFPDELKNQWKSYLGTTARVIEFDKEEMIDLTTPQLGSGPAYIFELARILINSLQAAGISQEDAQELITQMIYGASVLLKESKLGPTELRDQVTSKKGITEAALNCLSEHKLENIFQQALLAGYNRAKELSN